MEGLLAALVELVGKVFHYIHFASISDAFCTIQQAHDVDECIRLDDRTRCVLGPRMEGVVHERNFISITGRN